MGVALMKSERFFKLSNNSGSLGLSCDKQGVALAGVPLMCVGPQGLQPRPQIQLRKLVSCAYSLETDATGLTAGLDVVARALNQGDMARAMAAAVLLKLPDLNWDGAVRIAQAEEMLSKYSQDEPRDWHGRWTSGDEGSPVASANDNPQPLSAQAAWSSGSPSPPPTPAADPLALPDDWVHFSPGNRIDELADFAEWIANAKPEDEPALRAEVKRLFYDVGDIYGGDAVNAIISDAVEPGLSTENRTEILDSLDRYTHTDPADMATVQTTAAVGGVLLGLPGELAAEAQVIAPALESAEVMVPSRVWKLGWAARGQAIDRIFGNTLGFNFPVIDAFVDGLVTSIKSIDLNAGTYQSGARLLARINKYVDDLSRFDGAKLNDIEVKSSDIEARVLRLVIPKGSGISEQEAAISAARIRAITLNRPVKIIVSPY